MVERRVTEITIYPIKSTAGVPLQQCAVEARGLAMDRRWMVVDDQGEFITGRELPMLPLIRAQTNGEGLRVAAPGEQGIDIPFPDDSADKMRVTVWNDECYAQRAGTDADNWFTRILGIRCHLVYMNDDCKRPLNSRHGQPGDFVSFADGFPLLLISSASLEDLNARLPKPVSMRRFRPNVVVSGCTPYEEDGWRKITIGDRQFDGVKNCSRCLFTTIDPDTGEQHPELEPLRTLAGYRRGTDGYVFFGRKLIPRTSGSIRVGDVVAVDTV